MSGIDDDSEGHAMRTRYFDWTAPDRSRLDEIYHSKLVPLYGGVARYQPSSAGERILLERIRATPNDKAFRLVYADWLEEQGDYDRALVVRFLTGEDVREPKRLGDADETVDPAWHWLVDPGEEGTIVYPFHGFSLSFTTHQAGCLLECDDVDEEMEHVAEECMGAWAAALGETIDENTWESRQDDLEMNDEETDDDDEETDDDDEETDDGDEETDDGDEETDDGDEETDDGDEETDDNETPLAAFESWEEIVAYVREYWDELEINEDDSLFSRVWSWTGTSRTQLIWLTWCEVDGETWVRWGSRVASRDHDLKDLVEKVAALKLGRIELDDDAYVLTHLLPLRLITPQRLEDFSAYFAELADDLEASIPTDADEF